ncbi:MAG TPA: tetratricopeptide repeat protein [Gemmataceae bacterium]|nr:tetratricopeptide repeat protein [Gemmataceae bacterium]
MRFGVVANVVLLSTALLADAAEKSWESQYVVLTRAGVELQAPEGERVAPRTAGVAKDLTFDVKKDKDGRLLIRSRRQQGWIAKSDAVLFDDAVSYFTEQLRKNAKDSHALTARGIVLASKNQPDKAVADFIEAIRLNPKATVAYYHRANIAYGSKQYDKALDDYNAVIRLDPEFDWAYHVRGWIYYRKKDYDKALTDYETAIRLVPTETVFYRDRGNIAFARKQYDQALADYSKSIELDPKYAVPYLQRGRAWTAMKDYAKALDDFENAARLESKYSIFHTNLAMFRAGCPDAKFRDGKKALDAAKKAYELAKGPDEMAALAAAHAELGEFDRAVEWQKKAADAAPPEDKARHGDRLKLYENRQPYRQE